MTIYEKIILATMWFAGAGLMAMHLVGVGSVGFVDGVVCWLLVDTYIIRNKLDRG